MSEIIDHKQNRTTRKGLIIVHTGNGKGKTTAAFGLLLRAWGQEMRVCLLSFIKQANARTGEVKAAERLGIEAINLGDGFTWKSKDLDASIDKARKAWQEAQARICSQRYDLIVLDEFTYLLHYGWLDGDETIRWMMANKPCDLHLVITGRYAPQSLIDIADLVTDMQVVKHPYQSQGIAAQPGIEF